MGGVKTDGFGNEILATDNQGYAIKAPSWFTPSEYLACDGETIPVMWCAWDQRHNPTCKKVLTW